MVSQYSGQPRRRSTSRDQEDERAGQDNGGGGKPPTFGKSARILAAPRRPSTQDRARDTGGRTGSSPLGKWQRPPQPRHGAVARLYHFAGLVGFPMRRLYPAAFTTPSNGGPFMKENSIRRAVREGRAALGTGLK